MTLMRRIVPEQVEAGSYLKVSDSYIRQFGCDHLELMVKSDHATCPKCGALWNTTGVATVEEWV